LVSYEKRIVLADHFAIIGFCAVIVVLAGYVQKARSLEKVSTVWKHDIRVGMKMQITEGRIYPTNEDLVKAYVTSVFDNYFAVAEIRVIKGPAGHFVSMPNRKQRDGTYRNIAYPVNAETPNMIQ